MTAHQMKSHQLVALFALHVGNLPIQPFQHHLVVA